MILPVFEKAFGFVFEQTVINLMKFLKDTPICTTSGDALKLRLVCLDSVSALIVYNTFYKLVKPQGNMMLVGSQIVITSKTSP